VITCEVELPNGSVVPVGFDRVPCEGEQIEAEAEPVQAGDGWPIDLQERGNLFRVCCVRWSAREPQAVARPKLILQHV
jgi:hypothetical protein